MMTRYFALTKFTCIILILIKGSDGDDESKPNERTYSMQTDSDETVDHELWQSKLLNLQKINPTKTTADQNIEALPPYLAEKKHILINHARRKKEERNIFNQQIHSSGSNKPIIYDKEITAKDKQNNLDSAKYMNKGDELTIKPENHLYNDNTQKSGEERIKAEDNTHTILRDMTTSKQMKHSNNIKLTNSLSNISSVVETKVPNTSAKMSVTKKNQGKTKQKFAFRTLRLSQKKYTNINFLSLQNSRKPNTDLQIKTTKQHNNNVKQTDGITHQYLMLKERSILVDGKKGRKKNSNKKTKRKKTSKNNTSKKYTNGKEPVSLYEIIEITHNVNTGRDNSNTSNIETITFAEIENPRVSNIASVRETHTNQSTLTEQIKQGTSTSQSTEKPTITRITLPSQINTTPVMVTKSVQPNTSQNTKSNEILQNNTVNKRNENRTMPPVSPLVEPPLELNTSPSYLSTLDESKIILIKEQLLNMVEDINQYLAAKPNRNNTSVPSVPIQDGIRNKMNKNVSDSRFRSNSSDIFDKPIQGENNTSYKNTSINESKSGHAELKPSIQTPDNSNKSLHEYKNKEQASMSVVHENITSSIFSQETTNIWQPKTTNTLEPKTETKTTVQAKATNTANPKPTIRVQPKASYSSSTIDMQSNFYFVTPFPLAQTNPISPSIQHILNENIPAFELRFRSNKNGFQSSTARVLNNNKGIPQNLHHNVLDNSKFDKKLKMLHRQTVPEVRKMGKAIPTKENNYFKSEATSLPKNNGGTSINSSVPFIEQINKFHSSIKSIEQPGTNNKDLTNNLKALLEISNMLLANYERANEKTTSRLNADTFNDSGSGHFMKNTFNTVTDMQIRPHVSYRMDNTTFNNGLLKEASNQGWNNKMTTPTSKPELTNLPNNVLSVDTINRGALMTRSSGSLMDNNVVPSNENSILGNSLILDHSIPDLNHVIIDHIKGTSFSKSSKYSPENYENVLGNILMLDHVKDGFNSFAHDVIQEEAKVDPVLNKGPSEKLRIPRPKINPEQMRSGNSNLIDLTSNHPSNNIGNVWITDNKYNDITPVFPTSGNEKEKFIGNAVSSQSNSLSHISGSNQINNLQNKGTKNLNRGMLLNLIDTEFLNPGVHSNEQRLQNAPQRDVKDARNNNIQNPFKGTEFAAYNHHQRIIDNWGSVKPMGRKWTSSIPQEVKTPFYNRFYELIPEILKPSLNGSSLRRILLGEKKLVPIHPHSDVRIHLGDNQTKRNGFSHTEHTVRHIIPSENTLQINSNHPVKITGNTYPNMIFNSVTNTNENIWTPVKNTRNLGSDFLQRNIENRIVMPSNGGERFPRVTVSQSVSNNHKMNVVPQEPNSLFSNVAGSRTNWMQNFFLR